MAEPPSSAHGAAAAAPVSGKEPFGKLLSASRDPPGPLSAKKVRTEEKKAPRRLNGEGGSGGNSRQLQPPGAPSPQSYSSPASWSFAALSAAPSPSSARNSFSFTAVPSAASASSSQPLSRKLPVPPTLLHAQPQPLPPAAAASANAKPRRTKEKREKERRRHGLGGAGEACGSAREENGEVKLLPPRGGCRLGPRRGGGRVRQPGGGRRRRALRGRFRSPRGDRKWSLQFGSRRGECFWSAVCPSVNAPRLCTVGSGRAACECGAAAGAERERGPGGLVLARSARWLRGRLAWILGFVFVTRKSCQK